MRAPSLAVALTVALLASAAAMAETAPRARVLLLDYQAPIEHDVLQSFLCVEPCTAAAGCPASLVAEGADFWSDDFVVFRPDDLEGRAGVVVDRYREKRIDLLSLSGHHASGFSGKPGGPRFETERLGKEIGEVPGVAPFFVRPAMVLLQGCRTDVKSTFSGDPREYILHVIEETEVRRSEFDRLMAAVQQIGGVQQAYRTLFPNACILGYSGTQAPGGRFEIYFQNSGWLRALAALAPGGTVPPRRFDPAAARGGAAAFEALNRRIQDECAGGWPCNLCQVAPEFYRPLAKGLAAALRDDRRRLAQRGRGTARASALESALEEGSFYQNTTWSCAAGAPSAEPQWPTPVDESPFARLFAELLLLDPGDLSESERARLREELVHRLGGVELLEADRGELGDWLRANAARVESFIQGPLRSYSSFRQRDFFRFLARAGCSPCFASVFQASSSGGAPALLRENAAASLVPAVGSGPYRWALLDEDPRVRRAAAKRIDGSLDPALVELVRRDPDASVRDVTPDLPAAGSSR
jgi:hypothetical protein